VLCGNGYLGCPVAKQRKPTEPLDQTADGGRPHTPSLFHFDGRASLSELLLDGLRLFLGDAFLNALWRSIHQFLGFFQAQAGDFADRLDDIDLVGADLFEDDGEFGLLFGRSCCRRATSGEAMSSNGRLENSAR